MRLIDVARALGAPIAVFLILFAAAITLIGQYTSDPDNLRPELVAQITEQARGSAGAVPGFIDGPTAQTGDPSPQLRSRLAVAYSVLQAWTLGLALVGLGLSIAWAVAALILQRRAFGPAGQRAALPYWIACLAGYFICAAAMYFAYLRPLNLTANLPDAAAQNLLIAIALLWLLAFWIATVLAASPVMKPSVPLGTALPLGRRG